MDSVRDTQVTLSGFPHSEMPGSQVVCHLAEPYRRLPRPSSPLAAKASTVCASSLDHITPRGLIRDDDNDNCRIRLRRISCPSLSGRAFVSMIHIVKERLKREALSWKLEERACLSSV